MSYSFCSGLCFFILWETFDVFLHVVSTGDAGEREEV